MPEAITAPEPIEAPEIEAVEGADPAPPVEPEAFRAWDHVKKPEAKEPDNIPYSRFKDVNDERKAFVARSEILETKVAELEARNAELSKVVDPDDLEIGDFATPQEYLKAFQKATVQKARAEFEAAQNEKEQARTVEQQRKEIGERYIANITKATAANPEIGRAKEFFDEHASYVNPEVGRELLSDPNVGEVMHAIATNQDLLTKLFQGTPAEGIRLINRLSARIDAQRDAAPVGEAPSAPVVVPRAIDPRSAIRASLPHQVKHTAPVDLAGDLIRNAGKMTSAQYRAAREAGRVDRMAKR